MMSAMAGTMRALIYNNVVGVSEGYEKKLRNLVGVGYRAEVKNKASYTYLSVSTRTLSFMNMILTSILLPLAPTEVVIKGINKQKVEGR